MLVFSPQVMIIQCPGLLIAGMDLQKMTSRKKIFNIRMLGYFLLSCFGLVFANTIFAAENNFLILPIEQREKKILDELLSVHGPNLNQLISSQQDKNEIKRLLRIYIQSPQSLELFSKLQDWQKITAQENALSTYGFLIDVSQKNSGLVVSAADKSFLSSLRREMQGKPTDIMALKWYEALASTGSAWGLELLLDSAEQLPANEVAVKFKLLDLMNQHFFKNFSDDNQSQKQNAGQYTNEPSDYNLFSKLFYDPLSRTALASRINSPEQQQRFVQQYADQLKQLEYLVVEQKPLLSELQKMSRDLELSFPKLIKQRGTASLEIYPKGKENFQESQQLLLEQQRLGEVIDRREKNLRHWEQMQKVRMPAQKGSLLNGTTESDEVLDGQQSDKNDWSLWLLLLFPIALWPLLRHKSKK